ncbi:MAG: O-antigen ligase family protein [Candidatus Margulisiibacteriota bacterium]
MIKFRSIFAFILFFLPFAYSLVIDIKVPVKIYEIFFVLALFIWYMNGALKGEIKLEVDRGFRPIFYFFFWAVLVVIVSIFRFQALDSLPAWSARGSFFLNPIIELAYLLLNILLAIFIAKLIRNKQDVKWILKILLFSSLFVCLYGLYIFLGKLLQFPVLTLPTMSDSPGTYGFVLPRVSATFKEPNFFAGYITAIIPLTMAFFFMPKKTGLFGFISKPGLLALLAIQMIALTFSLSTGGVLSLVFSSVFIMGLLAKKFKNIRSKLVVFVLTLLLVGTVFIQAFNLGELVNLVVVEKLFGGEISPVTHSRDERLQQSGGAIALFLKYPLFGVGLANFGLYFDQDLGIQYGFEATANNIFAELLAETGLIGLLLFAWFFARLFRRFYASYKKVSEEEDSFLLIGIWTAVFAILISWNFFPSYSLSFFWVIFGLAIGYLSILERKTGEK